jgi:hypothetical protein
MVMAIRRRQVHPDEILTLRDGREIPVVSDEAWLGALLEMGRVVSIAGGTISGAVFREHTDLEGEMVTVHAVLEWKDRTDARPQPEPASAPPTEHNYGADLALEALREQAPAEAPSRDGGNGAGALPFQGVEQPVQTVAPREGIEGPTEAEMEAERAVLTRPAPAMTADGEPVLPRPAHDDDVDDGLSGVGGEDLSEIPEHMR